ncbi:hypothetical protein J8J19_23915, partial [Mycobacterium tuberculosis]|nr:hypothetical protein [Mycobacterium tuberculosis]
MQIMVTDEQRYNCFIPFSLCFMPLLYSLLHIIYAPQSPCATKPAGLTATKPTVEFSTESDADVTQA